MTQNFIVSVPGRAQPLCVSADSFGPDGFNDRGVSFRKGAEVVARLPGVDLVVKADCLPEFPALSQFQGPDVLMAAPVCMGAASEPGCELEPLPAQTVTTFQGSGGPAGWPFLAGIGLGFIGGFGLALSHAGVW